MGETKLYGDSACRLTGRFCKLDESEILLILKKNTDGTFHSVQVDKGLTNDQNKQVDLVHIF